MTEQQKQALAHRPPAWCQAVQFLDSDVLGSDPLRLPAPPTHPMSPMLSTRQALIAQNRDPTSLFKSLLLDPGHIVRHQAARQLIDVYKTDTYYFPPLATRIAVLAHVLTKSKSSHDRALGTALAKQMIEGLGEPKDQNQAFGVLLTCTLVRAEEFQANRQAAREKLSDPEKKAIINAFAKHLVELDSLGEDADQLSTAPITITSVSPSTSRLYDIKAASLAMACLSGHRELQSRGAVHLAAVVASDARSAFELLLLSYFVSTDSPAGAQLRSLTLDPSDFAQLAPWYATRFGNLSTPATTTGGKGAIDQEAARLFGEGHWASISDDLITQIRQFCASRSALAVVGSVRLLRAIKLPNDTSLCQNTFALGVELLSALVEFRALMPAKDKSLTVEISSQLSYLARSFPQHTPPPVTTLLVRTLDKLATLEAVAPQIILELINKAAPTRSLVNTVSILSNPPRPPAAAPMTHEEFKGLTLIRELVAKGLTAILENQPDNSPLTQKTLDVLNCWLILLTSPQPNFAARTSFARLMTDGFSIAYNRTMAPHKQNLTDSFFSQYLNAMGDEATPISLRRTLANCLTTTVLPNLTFAIATIQDKRAHYNKISADFVSGACTTIAQLILATLDDKNALLVETTQELVECLFVLREIARPPPGYPNIAPNQTNLSVFLDLICDHNSASEALKRRIKDLPR